MINIAIIIVSWNTRDLLRRCIASVHASLAASGMAYRVVVVDNASSDGTAAMLRAEHPEVLLLESGANLGFSGGNNIALRALLKNQEPRTKNQITVDSAGSRFSVLGSAHSQFNSQFSTLTSKPEYVLLLNPDTEVIGDAIPQLARYLDEHPAVDVVGPQLRYADGSPQPSRRRFPSPGVFFWESTPLETRWPGNPWVRRYRMADMPDDRAQPVGWLVGAALLVRRAAIVRAGLLDEGYAMYSEELEWQERIQRTKNKEQRTKNTKASIVYLPSATIIHHEGKSSEQAPARRYVTFHRSRLHYARARYGRGFVALLRAFLLAVYGAELLTEATKWLLGHKRALRAGRVRVYATVLWELARWV